MEELRRRQPTKEDIAVVDVMEGNDNNNKDDFEVIVTLSRRYLERQFRNRHFRRRFLLYLLLVLSLLVYFGSMAYRNLGCQDSHLVTAYRRDDDPDPVYFTVSHDDIGDQGAKGRLLNQRYRLDKRKSDVIPLNRELLDTRPVGCKVRKYHRTSLRISVIVILDIAPTSTVLRLLYSIISRTPPSNLAEILLYAHQPCPELEEGIKTHRIYPAKVIHAPHKFTRLTRSAARNFAAEAAIGDVLVFTPEASEVLIGWSEPLLEVMANNSNTLVGLSKDEFDPKTLVQIEHVPWHLTTHPRWDLVSGIPIEIPEREQRRRQTFPYPNTVPVRTPIIIFEVWAVGREFYERIGGLDASMQEITDYTPGDLVELSIRAWGCHGNVAYLPCSKISVTSLLPDQGYSESKRNQVVLYNSRLVADRWAGQHMNFYEQFQPGSMTIQTTPNSQIDDILRKEECKDLSWYIRKVAVDWKFGDKIKRYGAIQAARQARCIDHMTHDGRYSPGRPEFYGCHGGSTQTWILDAQTSQIQTETGKCLRSDGYMHDVLTLGYCNDGGEAWEWHGTNDNMGYLKFKSLCLEHRLDTSLVLVKPCNKSPQQEFIFEPFKK